MIAKIPAARRIPCCSPGSAPRRGPRTQHGKLPGGLSCRRARDEGTVGPSPPSRHEESALSICGGGSGTFSLDRGVQTGCDRRVSRVLESDRASRGGRWLGSALRQEWNRAARSVGIHARMYERAKHSSASAVARRGVRLEVIQQALGHADPRSAARCARLAPIASVTVLRPECNLSAGVSGLLTDSEHKSNSSV